MRNSNIELYRIVLMLIIIAHHYVVNSGIMDSITKQNALNYKSVFSSVFGCVLTRCQVPLNFYKQTNTYLQIVNVVVE